MKCTNCGAELIGKFCTNCGTPAPTQNDETAANTVLEQNSAPTEVVNDNPATSATEQQPQDFQAQPYDTAQNNYQTTSDLQGTAQQNQTSFGQQFTNAQGGYTGQQFTNGQPPKKSGGNKTAIIIVSIVAGILLILGIIGGVVACNVVNQFSRVASDYVDEYSPEVSDFINEYSSEISDIIGEYSSEVSDFVDEYSSDIESALGEEKYDEASRFYYKESTKYDGLIITGYEMDYDIYDDAIVNITVPKQIDGKNVVEIEEIHAYYDEAYVTVTIPGTVKVIRGYSMSFVEEFDEVIIEEGVEIIEEDAFIGNEDLKKITVPASVTQMDNCGIGFEVDDDYNDIVMKDAVIYGKKGSVAEAYAKQWGIKFVVK